MARPIADHIKNAQAKEFVKNLRNEYCGFACVYTSRYMTALSVVAGYDVYSKLEDDKVVHVVRLNGIEKHFKSAKDAGIYMEQKVETLFDFGIMV